MLLHLLLLLTAYLSSLGHLASILLGTLLEHTHAQTVLLISTLLLRLVEALAIDSLAVTQTGWLVAAAQSIL